MMLGKLLNQKSFKPRIILILEVKGLRPNSEKIKMTTSAMPLYEEVRDKCHLGIISKLFRPEDLKSDNLQVSVRAILDLSPAEIILEVCEMMKEVSAIKKIDSDYISAMRHMFLVESGVDYALQTRWGNVVLPPQEVEKQKVAVRTAIADYKKERFAESDSRFYQRARDIDFARAFFSGNPGIISQFCLAGISPNPEEAIKDPNGIQIFDIHLFTYLISLNFVLCCNLGHNLSVDNPRRVIVNTENLTRIVQASQDRVLKSPSVSQLERKTYPLLEGHYIREFVDPNYTDRFAVAA